jgi:hypothetical protein
MLYFGTGKRRTGGGTIAEAFRRAWSRLIRKQWLVLYPLTLALINAAAFFAVYASDSGRLLWGPFATAAFDRAQFLHDHFLAGFSFTPALGVAVFAGLAVSVFAAMIRAPYFRAIAGHGYPLTPRSWWETAQLSQFYLFANLAFWVLPLAVPSQGLLAQVVLFVVLIVSVLVAFADYAIVFEGLGFVASLRRSFELVRRRWVPVIVVVIVLQLVDVGLHTLYGLYYGGSNRVFILLPLSQLLLESILVLSTDLLLIFLYEQARQSTRD